MFLTACKYLMFAVLLALIAAPESWVWFEGWRLLGCLVAVGVTVALFLSAAKSEAGKEGG